MTSPVLLSRPFLLISIVNLLHGVAFHGFVHLPGRLHDLGASETAIGTIMSIMPLTGILGRPWVGRWMDHRGRRPALLVGGVLHATCCVMYAFVDTVGWYLILCRVVHGLAQALLFAVVFTIAADLLPERRRVYGLALFGSWGMASLSCGAELGDWVLQRWDYATLFTGSTGFCILALIASWWIPDSRPADTGESARPLRELLTLPALRPLWVMTVAYALGVAAPFTFLKTYLQTHQLTAVGPFFSGYAAAAIALRITLGWLPDRIGRKWALIPALCSLAACSVALTGSPSIASITLAGVLGGIGHGFTFPILNALVIQRCRLGERGRGIALFTAMFDFGVLAGAPILGQVIEWADYPTMFWWTAAVVCVTTVVFAPWDHRFDRPVRLDTNSAAGAASQT